ncbi:Set domain-containing protein [Teratosphaeria destructans]|uniref:Set domain-containing protein n=1 Tax=Teratosphaeria destructans TaxID=418781 RepID=A0A9W7SV00_9PEZI|nr:Set domain-containing protein [Teratosphaeria destructans]
MPPTAQTEALTTWLRDHGGYLHPAIKICQDEANAVHWRTEKKLSMPGTTLSTVPHSLTLSYLNALVDDAFPVFKQRRAEFKVEAMNFFYLCAQYLNKEKSFWKPYLDLLPSPEHDFTTPLYFDDPADLVWLEGTDILHTMVARREVHEQYYHPGLRALHRSGVDTGPYTWSVNLFRWAITMFTSRSFSSRAIAPTDSKYWTTYKQGPDGRRQTVLLDMSRTPPEDLDFPVLFPAIDAANHDPDAHVAWSFDTGRFSVLLNDGTVQAGEEVFNNYGAKGNDELLLGYGFCIEHNPNDGVLLVLKPPPQDLQVDLRQVHPGYFTTSGDWASERATFRLKRPSASTSSRPEQIFHGLPEPLLEMLLYICRHERGLPFVFYELPVEYLTSNATGRRYLPHIARMIVQSLAPKLAKLEAVVLPDAEPQNQKQRVAKIYRDSQLSILREMVAVLRAFTRSFLMPAAVSGARFVTLEGLIELWSSQTSPETAVPFIKGLEACSGTADVGQLRSAGWEEDAFVLLLAYIYLEASASQADSLGPIAETVEPESAGSVAAAGASGWVKDMLPEYVTATLSCNESSGMPADAAAHAESILELVATARQAVNEGSWSDDRWHSSLIVAFGDMLQFESMMMMVPSPDPASGEEARLVLYVHG